MSCDLNQIQEEADWYLAGKLYNDGDSTMLEKLLQSERIIPASIRPMLAGVVSGKLKVSRQGKSNARLTYQQKYLIYRTFKTHQRLSNVDTKKLAESITSNPDGEYVEASDIRKIINQMKAEMIKTFASECQVSEAAIIKVIQKFKPLN